MQSKLLTSLFQTTEVFSPDQLSKLSALSKRSDDFVRQMRGLEPNLVEREVNNLSDSYLATPTAQLLAAVREKMDEFHLLKVTGGGVLALVVSAHGTFMKTEALPFLLELVSAVDSKLTALLEGIEESEKKRSIQLFGDESGAAGALAHCARMRHQMAAIPRSFEANVGVNNPHFTIRGAVAEISRMGFDGGLLDACGTLEPPVEDRGDRCAKAIAEHRMAEHQKMMARQAEELQKVEGDRKAYQEQQEAAEKLYAAKHGLTYVPQQVPPVPAAGA